MIDGPHRLGGLDHSLHVYDHRSEAGQSASSSPIQKYIPRSFTPEDKYAETRKMISELLISITPLHSNDFSWISHKPGGSSTEGYVARSSGKTSIMFDGYLNADSNRKIKLRTVLVQQVQERQEITSLMKIFNTGSAGDLNECLAELVSGPFFERTLGKRVPKIRYVRTEDNKRVMISSQWLNNLISCHDLRRNNRWYTLGPIGGAEELFAAIMFNGEGDPNLHNVCVKKTKNGMVYCKIDNGRAMQDIFTDANAMLENLRAILHDFKYADYIKLDLNKFIQALQKEAKISDFEIEKMVFRQISILEKEGLDILNFDLEVCLNPRRGNVVAESVTYTFRNFEELKQFYVGVYKKHKEVIISLISNLQNHFRNPDPNVLEGGWLRVEKSKLASLQNAYKYAVENNIQIHESYLEDAINNLSQLDGDKLLKMALERRQVNVQVIEQAYSIRYRVAGYKTHCSALYNNVVTQDGELSSRSLETSSLVAAADFSNTLLDYRRGLSNKENANPNHGELYESCLSSSLGPSSTR